MTQVSFVNMVSQMIQIVIDKIKIFEPSTVIIETIKAAGEDIV